MGRRRRSFAGRAHGERTTHPNVTPLIDVVMCLIVFYLIVGRLAGDPGAARLTLPATRVGDQVAAPKVILSVAPGEADGAASVRLGGRVVAIEELAGELVRVVGDVTTAEVGVRADRRLSWGQVRPVVDACRGAGVRTVKLITERAASGGGGA